MEPNWDKFLSRLRAYPGGTHRLLCPSSEDRIEAVQRDLGAMPVALVDMVRHFGGAELFCKNGPLVSIKNGPLVSIFGISMVPPLSPLEWASDWYVDKFTPAWRSSRNRPNDWVIAMMNYGGLIVLDQNGIVREWDTAQRKWLANEWDFDKWADEIFLIGDRFLREE